ncbi:Axial regulator YABBY 4 [Morella rubra]|uniref:Axial regulator YABBY 4 n=1 Tax=Morella rubra TaxID=262757 RepID=A0A6A1V6T4_9ROSI|nr:Axial regulator YABBY 4 [Morella rubra]
MSTVLDHLFDLPDQICYVQCSFCTTILLVSVPCSSLSMVVTVRCGHCTNLLSVNMMKTSFVPLHLLTSFNREEPMPEKNCAQKVLDWRSSSIVASSEYEEEDIISVNQTVNKPPEKRQRAPSAYNRFIKEEIKRLKAENPNMAHKEAFSTAAKNWAHFPPFPYKGDEGYSKQEKNILTEDPEVHEDGKLFV